MRHGSVLGSGLPSLRRVEDRGDRSLAVHAREHWGDSVKDYQALLRQLEGPDLPLYDEAREAIEELLSREVVIRDTGGDDYYVGGMTDITQDQRLATAGETTPADGIASPLHPLVMDFNGRSARRFQRANGWRSVALWRPVQGWRPAASWLLRVDGVGGGSTQGGASAASMRAVRQMAIPARDCTRRALSGVQGVHQGIAITKRSSARAPPRAWRASSSGSRATSSSLAKGTASTASAAGSGRRG